MLGLVLEIFADARRERRQIFELTHVFRELIVELRQNPALQRLHADGVDDILAGQLGDRVVGGVVQRERLRRVGGQPEQLFVEAGRIRFRADLDRHVLVRVGLARGVFPLEIHGDRVAVLDAPSLDWLVPRGAIAQPLQREVDGLIGDDVLGAGE